MWIVPSIKLDWYFVGDGCGYYKSDFSSVRKISAVILIDRFVFIYTTRFRFFIEHSASKDTWRSVRNCSWLKPAQSRRPGSLRKFFALNQDILALAFYHQSKWGKIRHARDKGVTCCNKSNKSIHCLWCMGPWISVSQNIYSAQRWLASPVGLCVWNRVSSDTVIGMAKTTLPKKKPSVLQYRQN